MAIKIRVRINLKIRHKNSRLTYSEILVKINLLNKKKLLANLIENKTK